MILSGPASPISPGSMGFLTPLWPRGPSPLSARCPVSPATSAFALPSHLCPQPLGHCHGGGFITMGDVLWPSLTSPTWERTGYLSLYGLYQHEHNSHESDSSACGFVSLSATFTARSPAPHARPSVHQNPPPRGLLGSEGRNRHLQ